VRVKENPMRSSLRRFSLITYASTPGLDN